MGRPERHEGLYRIFAGQTVADKTLHVLDEGDAPSPFFTSLEDRRVHYRHEPAPPRVEGVTTIGRARNRLLEGLSPAESIVAHFDDDDYYAPGYLAVMVARLDAGHDLVKLAVWNALLEHDGTIWQWDTRAMGGDHFVLTGSDAPVRSTVPAGGDSMTADWTLWGYGFSYVYRRALWDAVPFPAEGTEDYPWVDECRRRGARLGLVADGAELCLHTVHPKSESAIFPQRRLAGETGSGPRARMTRTMLGAVATSYKLPVGQPIRVAPGATYHVIASVKNKHSMKSLAVKMGAWGVKLVGARDQVDARELGVPPAPPGYRLVQVMATATRAGTMPWSVPSPLSVLDGSTVVVAWTDRPPPVHVVVPHELGLHHVQALAGRVARRSLGAPAWGPGPGGWSDLANNPDAPPAWGPVAQQLTSEGNGPGTGNYYQAQQTFLNAYNSINASDSGIGDVQALGSAGALVLQAHTALGAANNLAGLVQGLTSGVPSTVVGAVTGLAVAAVGIGVAANAVAPGVGAVLVFGLSEVGNFIESLLGQQSNGPTICGNSNWPGSAYQPQFVTGCASTAGPIVNTGPNSNPWRRFPVQSRPEDAPWFASCGVRQIGQGCGPLVTEWGPGLWGFQWQSTGSTDFWYFVYNQPSSWGGGGSSSQRAIDSACPQYRQLECEASIASAIANLQLPTPGTQAPFTAQQILFAQFQLAYFAAWKCNAELYLNGLGGPKAPNDLNVLLAVARQWNLAHASSTTMTLGARNGSLLSASDSCPSTIAIPYVSMLMGSDLGYVTSVGSDTAAGFSNEQGQAVSLTLNMGPAVYTGAIPKLPQLPGQPSAPGANKGLSALATTGIVVGGVGAAGAIGTAIYAWHTKQSFGSALRRLTRWPWTGRSSER
jgi:hypothetical protein